MGNHDYRPFSGYSFEFDISTQVNVKEIPDAAIKKFQHDFDAKNAKNKWFNLVYPSLNAQIFCSYLPIISGNFAGITEESRKFAYLHTVKADAINEYFFANPEHKVYGLIYEIKGNVASHVQFVLTDSVTSFFRGALYFDNIPNQDSIAPVLEYINEDIRMLMDSFRWKK
ncbi:MAG: gliding motility protein GldD [Candidatus Symbiothrix sp.]|jgi:gliding motility-associated lipoprotein GldD|nr:gliding motility protein GldD [Candidatus Symbiothrix sp.]